MSNDVPSTTLRLEVDGTGVALVRIDVADRPVNVFTAALSADLQRVVDEIVARDDIVGVLIASRQPGGFLAGADLKDLVGACDSMAIRTRCLAQIAQTGRAFRALERCGKPVAAAIEGAALGGGYELCLACHYRVLADDPKSVVGLPELSVGLIPGGGGTQRLPRLIGIERALPLMLQGTRIAGARALELGLVDAVVPAAALLDTARSWLLSHRAARQPWDVDGFQVPGGSGALAPHAPRSFGLALARVRRDTHDNEPAPLALLSAVYEGTQVPFDAGLAIEQRYFRALLAGPVARNLMRTLFIHQGVARKAPPAAVGQAVAAVRRLGIVGAGMMGAGIAQVAADAGLDVVLLDITQAAADAGRTRVAAAYAKAETQGRLTAAMAAARLGRIHAGHAFDALLDGDMVIEAVFEDRAAKTQVMAEAATALGALPDHFVWASNTSTLPIGSLAGQGGAIDPRRVIGLHFFSPVPRMSLVEVVKARETSPATLARALQFVHALGKTPIVVNDSPGFYTSRLFCAYIDEGMAMLDDGVAPALIENAARQAGFATGPLAVTDEVSLDLQQRVVDQAEADRLDERFQRRHARRVIGRMNAWGRLGRKASAGFHDFPATGPKRLWHGLREAFPPSATQPDVDEVKHRLLCIQALEAVRCLDEGVLLSAADGDLAAVLGLGFPSWTGGPLAYVDTVGVAPFVAMCETLADRHGERFRPTASLRDRAATGRPFYPAAAEQETA